MSESIPAGLLEAFGHCVAGRWRSLARQSGSPACAAADPLLAALKGAAVGGPGPLPDVALAFAHLQAARQWLVLGEQEPALGALGRYLSALQRVLEASFGALPAALCQELEGAAEPLLHTLDSQLAVQRLRRAGVLAPQLTIVLGMHRSGTSALSGLLCRAGWDPPRDLLPSSVHNPLGYWESTALMRLNDRLLQRLDRRWCIPEPLPVGWQNGEAARAWRRDLLDLLPAMFGDARRPLIKDPRLCLLLPALTPWLEGGDLEVLVLLSLRHPYEVGRSLEVREGMRAELAVRLWLQHVFEAERVSRGHPRAWVCFRSLLERPEATLVRCRRCLGMPLSPAGPGDRVEAAIDPGLHRQRLDQAQEGEMAAWLQQCRGAGEIALELHGLLQADGLAEQPHGQARIDRLRRRWLASAQPDPVPVAVHCATKGPDFPS